MKIFTFLISAQKSCFRNIYALALQDLVKVHKCLMAEIQDSIENKNAENLHHIFIVYKDKYESSFFTYSVIVVGKNISNFTDGA